jgi:UDP-3-O-acyl-N-acetylglucosamine deacetylase
MGRPSVEHLLAAVAAHEIAALLLELSGPEPPILDGSVAPYFAALQQAGPVEVDGEPTLLSVLAPFTVTEGESSYVVARAVSSCASNSTADQPPDGSRRVRRGVCQVAGPHVRCQR